MTRLKSIYTSKNIWKFLIKFQLTKANLKRTRVGKCPASCQLGFNQPSTKLCRFFHLKRVSWKIQPPRLTNFIKLVPGTDGLISQSFFTLAPSFNTGKSLSETLMYQLTHNMTTDCSLNYEFSTCCVHKGSVHK